MKDIDWPYNIKKGPSSFETTIEEQYEKYKKIDGFEENKHKIFAFWVTSFEFPEEEGWNGRNMMFILTRDDNGEPYEVGHRQSKFKILKNEDGKYYTEPLKR